MLNSRSWWIGLVLLAGCGGSSDVDPAERDEIPDHEIEQLVEMTPLDRLVRTSMALRGIRPSMAEMERVQADPAALDEIIEEYLASVEFLEKVAHMHSEIYLLGDDTEKQLPPVGPLGGHSLSRMFSSQVEEPLQLVKHVVDNDLPYTEIVTADYMFANEIVAEIYGLPYDHESPVEWQKSHWTDGRPEAGLLSSGKLLRRWISAGSNFNRARANMVASKFLCSDFNDRDILLLGGVDVSDEFAVADAVRNVPECVACHQSLDPLAGYFWGFMDQLESAAILISYEEGCGSFDYSDGAEPMHGHNQSPEFMCYPVRQYNAFTENDWAKWDLREPGYFGQPADTLSELGELIADDPRFHSCTARHFFGYFDQVDPESVPLEIVTDLQDSFVSSGFSAKELARQVVNRPEFTAHSTLAEQPGVDPVVSMKTVRPEEYGTVVEDLTGYRWMASGDQEGCETEFRGSSVCWGAVDLNTSDLFGFRSMTGGLDGMQVTEPIRSMTAVKLMAAQSYATDAAAFVVIHDFATAPESRRLLKLVEPETSDEEAIREQLAWLHARVLAEFVPPEDEVIDASYGLWSAALAKHGDPESAWMLTLTALLQDPRLMFY